MDMNSFFFFLKHQVSVRILLVIKTDCVFVPFSGMTGKHFSSGLFFVGVWLEILLVTLSNSVKLLLEYYKAECINSMLRSMNSIVPYAVLV